jgi:hypothetical protein
MMIPGASPFNRIRAIGREAERINRKPSRTRRRHARAGKPIGPRLVRGRGLARRRPGRGLARVVVHLVVAAALSLMLWKWVLLPFLVP